MKQESTRMNMWFTRPIAAMPIFESLERRTLQSGTAPLSLNDTPPAPSSIVTAASAVVQTTSKLAVFSTDQAQDSPSFNAMIRASMELDPTAEAQRIAPLLVARRPGDRAIYLWAAMDASFRALDPGNPAQFVANGLSTTHDQHWCQTFFMTLRSLGALLDRVSTDSESGFSTWVLFGNVKPGPQQVAIMQGIYGNAEAYAKLPDSVRAFSPADFSSQFSPRGWGAYDAWNRWASSVVAEAYKEAIVNPLQQVYGNSVAVGNYGDIAARAEVLDKNGWPMAMANGAVPGNVSAPECYLWNGNEYGAYQKDWRWNRLIDVLNTVRACQNVPNVTVTPWISYPTFQGDYLPNSRSTWLWEQMVRQMTAGGVSTLYYWNPYWTPRADNEFADALFKSLTPGGVTSQSLQPIAFDADKIVTGNVTTTYADFLKYVDQPGATSLGGSPAHVTSQVAPAKVTGTIGSLVKSSELNTQAFSVQPSVSQTLGIVIASRAVAPTVDAPIADAPTAFPAEPLIPAQGSPGLFEWTFSGNQHDFRPIDVLSYERWFMPACRSLMLSVTYR